MAFYSLAAFAFGGMSLSWAFNAKQKLNQNAVHGIAVIYCGSIGLVCIFSGLVAIARAMYVWSTLP